MYKLIALATVTLALGITATSAQAGTDSVCIEDSGGNCVPGYAFGPVSASVSNGAMWDSADGKHCYQTGSNGDRWYRGSVTYGRGMTIRGNWCSNNGRSAIVSYSFGPEFPHQSSCAPNNYATTIVSGGNGYSWVTKHFEVNYTCETIWPFHFNDRVWFNVRYGTYGAHYLVDWNGR